LSLRIVTLRYVRHGFTAAPDGFRTKLLIVLVSEHGEWWITAYHNVPVASLPPNVGTDHDIASKAS
jgi:hypothetical protein